MCGIATLVRISRDEMRVLESFIALSASNCSFVYCALTLKSRCISPKVTRFNEHAIPGNCTTFPSLRCDECSISSRVISRMNQTSAGESNETNWTMTTICSPSQVQESALRLRMNFACIGDKRAPCATQSSGAKCNRLKRATCHSHQTMSSVISVRASRNQRCSV